MEYLKTFAEEYGLRQVVESLAGRPSVQGAVLRLDDLWLTAWRLQETGRLDEWERWRWMWRYGGPSPYQVFNIDPNETSWIPRQPPDLKWRPPFWDEYSHMMDQQDNSPIHLIVCLRPPASGENVAIPDLPRSRLSVRFEVRPLARLSTSQRTRVRPIVGGVSVGSGPNVFGTLGGVVEDQTSRRYGVTCAHVFPSATSVDQPARRDDANTSVIGMSSTTISLQPCPGTGPCNPYTIDSHIASADTALIELDTDVSSDLEILSIGSLAGVVAKNSMTPGQEVSFEGRTSGKRIAEIGGLAIFYRLQINKQAYCYRDLFEIRWRSYIRALFGPVVQAGDSGAWVCAETDQGPAWCGQIIGEDRRIGYAAFAECTVEAWPDAGKNFKVT